MRAQIAQDVWNPWHGCHKFSEGCLNCYVYRRDTKVGRDASTVTKNQDFDLPVKTKREGGYRIEPNTRLYSCMTSDFFLPDADEWRRDAWDMIRLRRDVEFFIITKRITIARERLPEDWGDGYPNVALCCTLENAKRAAERMPVFMDFPARKKYIACEPLLEAVDLSPWLNDSVVQLVAGGESGENARLCRYEWILELRRQCINAGVSFHFKQTGANFEKDGRLYRIPRKLQHSQAKKADIDTSAED